MLFVLFYCILLRHITMLCLVFFFFKPTGCELDRYLKCQIPLTVKYIQLQIALVGFNHFLVLNFSPLSVSLTLYIYYLNISNSLFVLVHSNILLNDSYLYHELSLKMIVSLCLSICVVNRTNENMCTFCSKCSLKHINLAKKNIFWKVFLHYFWNIPVIVKIIVLSVCVNTVIVIIINVK